jgi:phosphoribosylformimino-5-aminoimidazole carboxamide ribotide isomerase
MEIIPAVDVLDGAVVRLRRGRFDGVTVYEEDPVEQARTWVDRGAALVHVVDLTGARSGVPDRTLWWRLGFAGVLFQVGGGLREPATALEALEAGARRVVMGSAAVWDPGVVGELVATAGAERVVAALDVRDGLAVGSGWEDAGRPAEEVVTEVAAVGVRWVLATGIARDGMMTGPDLDLLSRLRGAAPEVALIASGGVGSLDDVRAVRAAGFEAVIIGRALYEGRFTLEEALRAAER